MQTSYLLPVGTSLLQRNFARLCARTVLAFIHEAVAIDGVITLYRVTKFPCGEPTKNVIRMPVECPSGEVHLQSGVTPRDDRAVGASGPVREITPCLEAEPSIYAGMPSSTISAGAV